jgi:L-glutamine:2-deoxy-scyllo-inosose/3-amino-2,3-dideoxy-scyllo-inosose aminotransferase
VNPPEPRLALLGGPPVHDGGWPAWPQADLASAQEAIGSVLSGPHWTVRSSPSPELATRRAERLLAERCGTRYGLAVTSGSAAVELALRALGIGPGQEVVVPALGWYATAAAVCRVGAAPVFADIDPETSCLDPAAAAAAITERTAAILVVHLHCAVADLASLTEVAERRGIYLIEDAAQAHGGAYAGLPVGGHGTIGCFSFNQEKALAIGEGGAVVTGSEVLYRRLHALRTDGYLPPEGGSFERPNPEVQGGNFCMSEIQAALLLAQIRAFDRQHELRLRHAARLEGELAGIPGVRPLSTAPATSVRPYYEFGMILDLDRFGDWPLPLVGQALGAELGAAIHPTDVPVTESPLFDPRRRAAAATPAQARALQGRLLVFHHRLLLSPEVCRAVPTALRKVLAAAGRLKAAEVLAGSAA